MFKVFLRLLSDVAAMLGYDSKSLEYTIKNEYEKFDQEKAQIWKENKNIYANPLIVNRALVKYYGKNESLKPYSFEVDGKNYESYLYTNGNLTSLNKNPLEIPMMLENIDSSTKKVREDHINAINVIKPYASKIWARLKRLNPKIEEYLFDDKIYMLRQLSEPSISMKYYTEGYFIYRFTTGLVEDELYDALIKVRGNIDKLIENKADLLPIRNQLIPSVSSFLNIEATYCQTGIVSAFALYGEDDDFIVTHQVRSGLVGDKQNSITLVPRAFHSYIVDEKKEVNMYWTVFRELFEELFGLEEMRQNGKYLSHDWYFNEDKRFKWFTEHDCFNLDALTLGADTLHGAYSLSTCFCVLDSWYYKKYGKSLEKSWESDEIFTFSTKNDAYIKNLFDNPLLLGDSKAHLVDVLVRLKEIAPKRVKLPDIVRL